MAILLTFATIHAALAAEKSAVERARVSGLEVPELVPLPPQVTSDCGFGLFVADARSPGDRPGLGPIASELEFDVAYSVVEIDGADGKRKEKRYEPIDQEDRR